MAVSITDQSATIRGALDQTWEALRPQLEASLVEQWKTTNTGQQKDVANIAQAARWLDKAENNQQWRLALVQATSKFAERTALFLIENGRLFCAAVYGVETETISGTYIPLSEASAFQTVVESGETVLALRRATEISSQLAAVFDAPEIKRAYLLPLLSNGRVAAILYAEGAAVNLPALELVVTLASTASVLNDRGLMQGNTTLAIAPTGVGSWNSLATEEKRLHLKAHHFARVKTAGLLLNRPLDVRAGRRRKAIYTALHAEIDSLRKQFAIQYFSKSANMVDYLHLELIRTIANDDATILGSEYPGPML